MRNEPMNTETPQTTITWESLARQEPGLASLLDTARTIEDDGESYFCVAEIWIYELKPDLKELVGWYRPTWDPVLSTSMAYEIAMEKILDALPPCRNCTCL